MGEGQGWHPHRRKRTVIPKPHDLGFCFFPLRGSAPALTE
jgi:hypothetical protein